MTYQTLDLVGHFVVPGQGDRLLGEEGRQQRITRGIQLRLDQQGIRLSWDTGCLDRVSFRNLQMNQRRGEKFESSERLRRIR
jgi:hypothetical protein